MFVKRHERNLRHCLVMKPFTVLPIILKLIDLSLQCISIDFIKYYSRGNLENDESLCEPVAITE